MYDKKKFNDYISKRWFAFKSQKAYSIIKSDFSINILMDNKYFVWFHGISNL